MDLARGGGHAKLAELLERAAAAPAPVVHERVGGLTYAASEKHARARGGRLPTLAEARRRMGGKALCPGDDQWCAVAGRDWVQIGDRHHHPGKSHVADCWRRRANRPPVRDVPTKLRNSRSRRRFG